jgi:hypothetical protein
MGGDISDEKREKLMRVQAGSICLGTDPIIRESCSMEAYKPLSLDSLDFAAARETQRVQRKRNWELGHDKFPTQSTMRGDFGYKKASSKERAVAEALKKDLTTAHYTLGLEDDTQARTQSLYQADMGPSALYSSGPLAHSKAVKPPCSVILGSESMPNLRSASQVAYQRWDLSKLDGIVDGKTRSAQLRKSNVLIGTDPAVWETNVSAVHRALNGKPAEPVIKKSEVNVTFGNDKPTLRSSIQMDFSQVDELREACRNRKSLDPAQTEEIKKVHFTFGTDAIPMETCSQAAFTEKRATAGNKAEMERIRGAMKKVYLTLGNDPPITQSCMREGYGAPDKAILLESALGAVREERKKANTRPNFDFGVDDESTRTMRGTSLQHADMRYGLEGVDYAQLGGLSQDVKADLRTHHFSFGNDQPIRRTASQEAYVPMKGKPGAMDASVKKDLRSHHFSFGEDKPTLTSTMRDQMVFHGRVDAALDPELKKDLRAVHYTLGREPMVKRSTYGNAFNVPFVDRLS